MFRNYTQRRREQLATVNKPADVELLEKVPQEPRKILGIQPPEMPAALEHYIDHGMFEVEGWAVDPFMARVFVVLDAYHKRLGLTGPLFELGVHHGRSAIVLGMLARPHETLTIMDLFERQSENIDDSGAGDAAAFHRNMAHWCPDLRLESHTANSMDIDFRTVASFSDGVRFAHIDGGHYREVVLNDLRKTEQVLAPHGIVVIDDFMHSGFPEVNEACHAYFAAQTRLRPVALGHNKLIAATYEHADAVRADLKAALISPLGQPVRFHGHEALCLDTHDVIEGYQAHMAQAHVWQVDAQ